MDSVWEMFAMALKLSQPVTAVNLTRVGWMLHVERLFNWCSGGFFLYTSAWRCFLKCIASSKVPDQSSAFNQ